MACRLLCHRATFGSEALPRAICAPSTASILPRTRLAVSGFLAQIGVNKRRTSAVVISETGDGPMMGLT